MPTLNNHIYYMMSATTEMLQPGYEWIPIIPDDKYPIWRIKVYHIQVAMREYNIVTGDQLISKG